MNLLHADLDTCKLLAHLNILPFLIFLTNAIQMQGIRPLLSSITIQMHERPSENT